MKFLPYDKPHFLEPAHDHDPTEVSNLTEIPQSISGALPNEIRELLPAVREATSIVFASFNRLDDLLSQRLERLTVVPNENRKPDASEDEYSEPAYFWYQNQVKTETQYMVAEALPDWKHKASKIANECVRQGIMLEPDITQTGAEADFARWFSTLKDEVQEWKRVLEAVEVPDFDLAVADLTKMLACKKSTTMNRPSTGAELKDESLKQIEKVDSGFGL